MRIPQTITLVQANNDDDLFIVDQCINTLMHCPGDVLKKHQVESLISMAKRAGAGTQMKIIVKRGKS